jgi:tetratricopeptide (TPR) repeat protein
MSLSRLTLLAFMLCLAGAPSAWSQSDPLQEANQLFRQGQFDRAMERVNGYLSSRPKDARGRFLKGLILTEQNRPNEAIKIFTELSQDYPELPEPYNNLAVLYASQGAYDKARNSLEMAIRTHPSYATAHENLGDIYAKMASQAYDKALQLDRSNQAAQGKLNMIRDLFSPTGAKPKAMAMKPEPVVVASAQPAPLPAKAAPVAAAAPAAESAPAPAAKAAEKKPEPAAPAAAARPNGDEVLRSVTAWARAWSTNDVPAYLGRYAADFQTPRGMSRAAWEAERKARIAKPRKIEVDIHDPRVTIDPKNPNRATVSFRQQYRSGTMNVTSSKTLVMVRTGDRWLIQQERVGS